MLQLRARFLRFLPPGRGGWPEVGHAPSIPQQAPMPLKVRIRSSRPRSRRGYRIRPRSFVLSTLFHAAVVGGLLLLPRADNREKQVSRRPVYEELIKPEAKKIIWYKIPKPLPEVSAQERIGTFPKPRAAEKSDTAIIATAPKPKSVKQFIWQAVPKIEIHQDLPAPNLIARAAMAIPAPPPPPEPRPKVDKPDTQGVKSTASEYLTACTQGRREQGAAARSPAGGSAQAPQSICPATAVEKSATRGNSGTDR